MSGLENYFRELIEQAKGGNVDAAKKLLDDFAKTAENVRSFRDPAGAWSGPVAWDVADYFASAFRKILDGTPPERALNIVGEIEPQLAAPDSATRAVDATQNKRTIAAGERATGKRGRPSKSDFAEHIADEVVVKIWRENARVRWGLAKPKGQKKIGALFIKQVCESVGQQYSISARTVETYYYRHGRSSATRMGREIAARVAGVRTVTQLTRMSKGKVFRQK